MVIVFLTWLDRGDQEIEKAWDGLAVSGFFYRLVKFIEDRMFFFFLMAALAAFIIGLLASLFKKEFGKAKKILVWFIVWFLVESAFVIPVVLLGFSHGGTPRGAETMMLAMRVAAISGSSLYCIWVWWLINRSRPQT
ncbi:hypothetical protein QQM79_21110 [Marinobacteraceae bacterium S3BR75-40.1]